jgi:cysteine-rich repeat protein
MTSMQTFRYLMGILLVVACGQGCSSKSVPPPEAKCGDHTVQGAEDCDDGNTADGDGCSATCTVESGWSCDASSCHTVCGDKLIAGAEACDDGNTNAGDGCSATCTVESGFACSGAPSTCQALCGDKLIVGAETCDDGSTEAGDGCSATCAIESGWNCSGTPSSCHAICGDKLIVGIEACDDGALLQGDGCDTTCQVETGWRCDGVPSSCETVCGDGFIAGAEACDDGTTSPGDGCSEDCQLEAGWECLGEPSVCNSICGDTLIVGLETCDDGPPGAGDGCDVSCHIETGWDCVGSPSLCASVCGDKIIVGNETCDDGPTGSGDGCSGLCQVEPGWTCTGVPSACQTTCGDGYIAGTETCDDGYKDSGDGCSSECQVESGWTCAGIPSFCGTTCGDFIVAGSEECDDANLTNLDGCNTRCQTDVFDETEANDTVAQSNGPWNHSVRLRGALQPAWDVDTYAVVLTSTTDLSLETTDDTGTGSCLNIDTIVTLFGPDGTTEIASDDDNGSGNCSKLDPRTNTALQGLPAGTYFVQVSAYNSFRAVPGYHLLVRFAAVCGDSVREGSEQCDSTAGCDAICHRIPTCGDGFIDGTETCDNGDAIGGDGCDESCHFELLGETEPNDSAAAASGPYRPDVLLGSAISPANDADYFAVQLTSITDLKIETFDASGPGSCVDIDTFLTFYGPDGTTLLLQKDQGGLANCAAIDPKRDVDAAARHLPPGTYFVKVASYLGHSTGSYQLRVTRAATCGNGLVEGSEECDGTPNCSATCDRVPECGDGFIDSPESCDDGNHASGDGCSANCQTEATDETEPNDTAAQATSAGVPFTLKRGAINPGSDVDWYAFTITTTSDVVIETFDGSGPGSCASPIDTIATLYAADGSTVLATQDDQGISMCSRIDPKRDAGARRLAPGTYFVKIEDFQNNNVIPAYSLSISIASSCGNGLVESYEQCDGTADCDATCRFVQLCGDGFVDGTETCDDGGTMPGDGCSDTCAIEGAETEPNNSVAQASTAIVNHGWVNGGISPVGDKDFYPLTLTQPSVIHLETFSANTTTCTIATTLRIYDAGGTQLYADDNSGVYTCSSLVLSLPAGNYFVSVEQRGNVAAIPLYHLAVTQLSSLTSELEPNEVQLSATPLSGLTVVALGSHQVTTDSDFFSFYVPEGRSFRAELIEGSSAETCESYGIDSFLTLYAPNGQMLGWDDDSGRGLCSRIDGTGDNADSSFASRLPAGTYTLQVEAAPFAQAPTNTSGQFDYRLVLSIR